MKKKIENEASTYHKFYHIVEKLNLWLFISGIVIVAGIIAMFTVGIQPSIDFTGGSNLMLQFSEDISSEAIRNELQAFSLERANIQSVGPKQDNVFMIRTIEIDNDTRLNILQKLEKNLAKLELLESDIIGPSIGKELTRQSVWIVLSVIGLLLLYITFRFEFWSGIAAIFALLHDALITIGLITIFKIEVDIAIVVAVLTILGYSINDTIVVFDRIRENMPKFKDLPFPQIANISITQTFTRSINTSLTVLFAILAIIIFGGTTIKPFAIVIFIGVASGTYSSIFIAAPILNALKKIKI